MTHTVHPYSFRLGTIRDWKSRWFGRKNYKEFLKLDTLSREWLTERLRGMHVASIEMERSPTIMNVIIKTSRPGLIIGRGGEGIERLKNDFERKILKWKVERPQEIKISVEEVRSPESNAALVSQMIAEDLEKRFPFRRVMRQALEKVSANRDVKGVKIELSGRLGGSEMSRREFLMDGRIPLQTIRADIDFERYRARLPYGHIGIKVWIYKGDVFADKSAKK